MVKQNNLGYDPDLLIASKELKQVVYLSGIGRFCKCGCGKRIEPVNVRSIVKGKIVYFKRDNKNKVFATLYCQKRYHSKKGNHTSKRSIAARIDLTVYYDKTPYRKIAVYLKKSVKFELRITEADKDIWKFLENIARNREIPKELVINQ